MPEVEFARDRAILNEAVRAAGKYVRSCYGESAHSWCKDDDSPVSEADHKANEIIHEHLIRKHGGGYGFLSEESADDTHRLKANRTWIVDPIDGTRAFLNGKPQFAVCVALVEDQSVIASAIFNPATDQFFEAARGQGARLNGIPIKASRRRKLENCNIIGHRHLFTHPAWKQPWPDMKISLVNSTSYRIALVAAGKADAAIALIRKYDWDMAPGALIATEAGAIMSDHKGDELKFNRQQPTQRSLVCAAPNLYRQVLERVQHLPADFVPGDHLRKGVL